MTSTSEVITHKVLIIDDEINGILLSKALEYAPDFFDALQDPDSPMREEIDEILSKNKNKFPIELSEDGVVNVSFLREVILSDDFKNTLQPTTLTKLTALYDQNERDLRLRNIIESAFPNTAFEVSYREQTSETVGLNLEDFDLLIIDWFLGTNLSNSFIIELSKLENTPPIILITSNPGILEPSIRASFFIETRISGAGLTVLPKNELYSENIGSNGLHWLSIKAIKQRNLANQIRNHIGQWEKALESAKEATLNTLWQLDSFIIKSIHNDAIVDSQPYNDHFHNFISREHSWHIEQQKNLNESTVELGISLNEMSHDELLTYHANQNTITLHRNLLNHYSFKGGVTPFMVNDKTAQVLRNQLLELLPFGAVIINTPQDSTEPTESFVNITQPCDLSNIVRSDSDSSSITLMSLPLSKQPVRNSMSFNTSDYLITSLSIQDSHYDMTPKPSSTISQSFTDFYAKASNLKVVGTLRPDITVGLQQKAVAYMIRPSQQRVNRPAFGRAKLFIHQSQLRGDGTREYEVTHLPLEPVIEFIGISEKVGNKDKYSIQIIGNSLCEIPNLICQNKSINDPAIRSEIYNFFNSRMELKEKTIASNLKFSFEAIESLDDAENNANDKPLNKGLSVISIYYEKFHK